MDSVNNINTLDQSCQLIDWKKIKRTVVPATANCLVGAVISLNPSSFVVGQIAKKCFLLPWEAVITYGYRKMEKVVKEHTENSQKNMELVGVIARAGYLLAPLAVGYKAAQYCNFEKEMNLAVWISGSIFGDMVQQFVAFKLSEDPFIASDILSVNNENFQKEVLESDLPVIIDAYGSWCPPCREFFPTFLEASKKFEGKVKFVKFNIDDSKELANKLNIQVVPSFFFFKEGKLLDVIVGSLPKLDFFDKLETFSHLAVTS